jgi:ubiquinone/menaquinone biosynthesis C-methylase UbiE
VRCRWITSSVTVQQWTRGRSTIESVPSTIGWPTPANGPVATDGRRCRAVRVSLAINDARSLCFRETAFDAIFMSFVLDLFETVDIPVVLAEIERVLRPAGRLVVVGMAESVSSGTTTDIYQWLHRHFPLVVDCRPIDVVGVLERAGFHVTRTQAMSICGLAVASTVARKSVTVGGLPR